MPHLSSSETRDRATRFARTWSEATSERADKQTFWNEFFDVFGLRRASLASFEENVRNLKGNTGAIDLLWRGKLIVEGKSRGESLEKAKSQAFTYIEDLTRAGRWEDLPRYVLVSDFAQFVLYDLEPEEQRDLPLFAGRDVQSFPFSLTEFPRQLKLFRFMQGPVRAIRAEDPANEKAYDRICELHDRLKTGGFDEHDLQRLLVRILFCMFAEDTGIFEQPDVFTHFIRTQTRADGSDLGAKLNELFDWLNDSRADAVTDENDPYHGFRYVNGGLFAQPLRFARFNREMRDSLLFCCEFLWERISPAVFGSLFQGIKDKAERRKRGEHYTSERDIMKVIRSLFLDDLRAEWERRLGDKSTRRRAELEAFHGHLRSLHFLDPACGCGNFLVLAYRELRQLEIGVVTALYVRWAGEEKHAQREFAAADFARVVGVNVDQFHGIEIGEWPVRIAEVALWLMDHQMNQQAAEVFGHTINRLPLTTAPHIVHANALQISWESVLPPEKCSYMLGNPPFVGKALKTDDQPRDMADVWQGVKGAGVLDFVTAWYRKAAAYIQGTRIPVAFVSTSSISQGEQVGILWGELFQRYHIKIHFAHRTFAWASEARGKAHVHVVIIGFGAFDTTNKRIFDYEEYTAEPLPVPATNISPYLVEGPDVAITKRRQPICDVSEIAFGSMANDGGYLMLTDAERASLVSEEPAAAAFVRPILGSDEFINGIGRWCLWLKEASPATLRSMPAVMRRVEKVREIRLASPRPITRALAAFPTRFGEDRQPSVRYLAIPKTSSEGRAYIPMGFLEPNVVANTELPTVAGASEFEFGVLTSTMHMAWMRQVAGRLESRYRYSAGLVYNNFPWPTAATPAQRATAESAAQAVLAAREPHLPPRGMSTLADLYDPNSMPPELVRAHAALDRAVERCYRPEPFRTDRERVEHLFRLYETLTAPLLPATPRPRTRRRPVAPPAPRPDGSRTPRLPAAP